VLKVILGKLASDDRTPSLASGTYVDEAVTALVAAEDPHGTWQGFPSV
jgi:hypothetical protein